MEMRLDTVLPWSNSSLLWRTRRKVLLSVWYLITILVPDRAGFLGPGRITLGAHFGGTVGWLGICSRPEDRY